MVEVLFDEGAAATMQMAKEKGYINGTKEKVICLAFMLDIGDINCEIDSEYRKELIYQMYTQNVDDNNLDILEELKNLGSIYANEHKKLMYYISRGESIRIWYCNAPYSICGLYYLCSLLKNVSNKIYIVKLSDYKKDNKNIVIEYKRWGEVPPEEISMFIKDEKQISEMELKIFSDHWVKLKDDNSSLRAVINGELIGVPEDFYDYLIFKSLSKGAMKEVRLISDILAKYPLGISDWWYALRINKMIENSKIKIVKDSKRKYTRIIEMERVGINIKDNNKF